MTIFFLTVSLEAIFETSSNEMRGKKRSYYASLKIRKLHSLIISWKQNSNLIYTRKKSPSLIENNINSACKIVNLIVQVTARI